MGEVTDKFIKRRTEQLEVERIRNSDNIDEIDAVLCQMRDDGFPVVEILSHLYDIGDQDPESFTKEDLLELLWEIPISVKQIFVMFMEGSANPEILEIPDEEEEDDNQPNKKKKSKKKK